MEPRNKLALYVAYYLARFNTIAYANLGFKTMLEAHNNIGKILGVNPHTIKNMRDQFDPIYGHCVGWYQVPLSPSRLAVVAALENLDENSIKEIVLEILSLNTNKGGQVIEDLINIIPKNEEESERYILRTLTGKAAEEYFIKYYSVNNLPIKGNLIDTRDLGVGYDFRIETEHDKYYIEVKGLSELSGGLLFTNKEWETAQSEKENYILCIVSSAENNPTIKFVRNPFSILFPKKYIYTTIQVNWVVSEKQLAESNE
jgi:hypothetical protein